MARQGALTAGLFVVLALLSVFAMAAFRRKLGDGPLDRDNECGRFWTRQLVRLTIVALGIAGLVWIWAPAAGGLGSVVGVVTAGIAVALQRMIMSVAAYFVILRGKLFTVGDRITIGGVRGDVVSLGFTQTTVLEMGEPNNVNSGDPQTWVNARQYTGRIVRITNDKVFDTPVYNYTREFPFMWEEMHFPIAYGDDYRQAEAILLDVSKRHTESIVREAGPAVDRLRARYYVAGNPELAPRVYLRMTDNWIEVSLRFMTAVHGGRNLKDAMTREILPAFESAGIKIASSTYEITGLPAVHIVTEDTGPSSVPAR